MSNDNCFWDASQILGEFYKARFVSKARYPYNKVIKVCYRIITIRTLS